jgi:hypothetical protein
MPVQKIFGGGGYDTALTVPTQRMPCATVLLRSCVRPAQTLKAQKSEKLYGFARSAEICALRCRYARADTASINDEDQKRTREGSGSSARTRSVKRVSVFSVLLV